MKKITLKSAFDKFVKEKEIKGLNLTFVQKFDSARLQLCESSLTGEIILGSKYENKFSLFHELRHAYVHTKLLKLSKFLTFYRKFLFNIFSILGILLIKLLITLSNLEIHNAWLYALIGIIFLPVWVEELDANLFALKREKRLTTFLYSQFSYSIYPLITILIV